MTTFSDGFDDSRIMDSLNDNPEFAEQAHGHLRVQLQALLDDKEKQLKLAGTLGQRVLAQQVELEERIQQLNELEAVKATASDEDTVESEIREKLRELRDTMNAWESENHELFDSIGNKVNDVPPSPPHTPLPTLGVEDTSAALSASPSGPSAAQSSRRAKNAAHRAHDVEFAFEIGSSLLTEVRRLQSLIAERDKGIQDLKEENQDLLQAVEDLKSSLESQKSTAEKYKEENWNLEVTLQELRTQLGNAQKDLDSAELDRKRTTRELQKARDAIDTHKNEAERLTTALADFKAKHETDIAQMRKQAAGLQREKSDLQSTIEALKADMAKKERSIKRFGSPLTPNGLSPYHTPGLNEEGEEEDVFGNTGGASTRRRADAAAFGSDAFGLGPEFEESPENSPSRPHLAPNHPSNEIEVLKQSLAHAQRQVNMLRGTVHREKELSMTYRRKLAEIEGKAGPRDFMDDDEEEENVDPTKPRPPRPPRTRGRGLLRRGGRGGRSMLAQRIALSPGTPDSEMLDDIDETEVAGEMPEFSLEEEEDTQRQSRVIEEDEIPARDRRVSVEGMDPAFANILKNGSSPVPLHGSSPLRGVTTAPARGGRRTRGAAPRQPDSRPSSIIEPAGALAAELGMTEDILSPELVLSQHVETAEFSCQTDPIPEPEPKIQYVEVQVPGPAPEPEIKYVEVPGPTPEPEIKYVEVPGPTPEPEIRYIEVQVPAPPPPSVETHEIAIQVEEEPVPPVATAEFGLQAEPPYAYSDASTEPHKVVTNEVDIQTVPAPAPKMSEMHIQTTSPPSLMEMQTQTSPIRPNMPAPIPISVSTNLTGVTRRGTIVRANTGGSATDDDGEATETETGTETEGEYTDAHEYPAPTPVSESVTDFYSTRTGPVSTTDMQSLRTGTAQSAADFYSVQSMPMESDADDSDQESIKASRSGRARTTSRTTVMNVLPAPPPVKREDVSTQTPLSPPPPPPKKLADEGIQVEEIKPDIAESSIQTDEWVPPAPAPTYGLFRVGSHTQQFQYIAPPASPTSPAASTSQANSSKDTSTLTIVPRRTSSLVSRGDHGRRLSIEAALSGEDSSRARTQSASLMPPPDKTRPPTMMLPPPPRMPPPSTIPEKKMSTASSRDMPPPRDVPPPRPTSPPPPELIQRATTPTFYNQGLAPSSRSQIRQHGASMPPPQQGLGHRPSTNSFRSAANAAAAYGGGGISSLEAARRHQSAASLVSSQQSSSASRRSSLSSDHHNIRPPHHVQSPSAASASASTSKPAPQTPGRTPEGGTDPAIIHAITQTMIGEFLYKYTRKVVGKGHGEKRHKRFFWVHPYTKTLYWSSADPGSSNVSESSAKSAYIESVRSVLDPNPLPPGLHQWSVIVSTPQREMKITAPTKERHDIWFNALNYLLTRPTGNIGSPMQRGRPNTTPGAGMPYGSMRLPNDESARNNILASPRSGRSIGSALSGDSWNITPRAARSQSRLSVNGSVGKRSGTPAAEYLRLNGPEGPVSPSKSDYEYVPGHDDDEDLDFEIHDSIVNGEGFEGLENVRACCDGRHDLGTLSRKPHHHHHHHHHHHPPPNQNQYLDAEEPISRPVSPAWSFRSRAGSTASRGHGGDTGSIWSRFGSKRSKNPPPVPTSPGGNNQ